MTTSATRTAADPTAPDPPCARPRPRSIAHDRLQFHYFPLNHRRVTPKRGIPGGSSPGPAGYSALESAQMLTPDAADCRSIAASSAALKAAWPAAARFSSSWATLLAPISTEVTR